MIYIFYKTELFKKWLQNKKIPVELSNYAFGVFLISIVLLFFTKWDIWGYLTIISSIIFCCMEFCGIIVNSISSVRSSFKMLLYLALLSLLLYYHIMYLNYPNLFEPNQEDFISFKWNYKLFGYYYLFCFIFMLIWISFNLIMESKVSLLFNGLWSSIFTLINFMLNIFFLSLPSNYTFGSDIDINVMQTMTGGWTMVKIYQVLINSLLIPPMIVFHCTSMVVKIKDYWSEKYYLPLKRKIHKLHRNIEESQNHVIEVDEFTKEI